MALLAGGAAASEVDDVVRRGADPPRSVETRMVVAGPDYAAGDLHRLFFGDNYRDLWTTPIRVPVLDLDTFSGGLTPTKKGGGKQTRSLTFKGGDGRKWKVRSVNKDPTAALPPGLRETFVDRLAQDQISAEHPGGPLALGPLADAAGILHVERRLVLLPDHPGLGEFRKDFAGMLGSLEEIPSVEPPVTRGFEGFSDIQDTTDLWERLDQHPEERVDTRAFLKARLLDLLIGDYDRHVDQWDWALRKDRPVWEPLAKDRDLAFVRFKGLVMDLVRQREPRLASFDDQYPNMVGLTWQGRFVDRRHLANLEWPVWQEVVADLQARMTEKVIDDAVSRLPPEYARIDGPAFARRLKNRRRLLPEAARRFYRILARETEIHGTDKKDVAEILRGDGGEVEVRLSAADDGGLPGEPYFRRRFLPDETREVRIFLKGGDDRAVSIGKATSTIKVRVVGGDGSDTLDDSRGGKTHFYDSSGENGIVEGPGTRVNTVPYEQPVDRDNDPQRDWGRWTTFAPWFKAGGDFGLLLGGGVDFTSYGFRKYPYDHRHSVRAGYATGLGAGRIEYEYESLRFDSQQRWNVLVSASELSRVRFHGFGNETAFDRDAEFYRVEQREYALGTSFYRFNLPEMDLSLGARLKYTTTSLPPDRFVSTLRPYGATDFGQAGPAFRFVLDRRDRKNAPRSGALVTAGGAYYPPVWSVDSGFGEVHGDGAVYLSPPLPLQPTLALRVGGQRVWGRYPFHEAAYLGGPDTVRGLRRQRYAGDAAVFGNSELRLRLAQIDVIAPADIGVFVLADAGRVFLDGESSSRWHTGVGGGLWLALLKRENTFTLAVARSEGKVRVYLQTGFMF